MAGPRGASRHLESYPSGARGEPLAVARFPAPGYSPRMATTNRDPSADAEVRPHREARALRERRRRMLARRRRAIALGTLLVVPAIAGAAYALARSAPVRTASLAEAGAVMVARVRTSPVTPEKAVAGFQAYAKELAKPKAPVLAPLTPAPGVKTIVVDKGDQLVTLYAADGTPVERFQCASGELYPRVGTYTVFSRKPASMSTYDDSRFYHFVIFTKSDTGTNIGFHSIPIDAEGVEIGGLGKPVSHGCVRLAHEKAELVYDWAPNGTKVIVRN